jgi:Zn finger protein HypA/HybF involved in hydrogenase expression
VIYVGCHGCGHRFSREATALLNGGGRCPRCASADLDLAELVKKADASDWQANGEHSFVTWAKGYYTEVFQYGTDARWGWAIRPYPEADNPIWHNVMGAITANEAKDEAEAALARMSDNHGTLASKQADYTAAEAYIHVQAMKDTLGSMFKGAPFAGYKDFDACVAANQDKDSPERYCGKIKHQVEDGKKATLGLSCKTCGKPVSMVGGYWVHTGGNAPADGHEAVPDHPAYAARIAAEEDEEEPPYDPEQCPACGSHNTTVMSSSPGLDTGDDPYWWMLCQDCGFGDPDAGHSYGGGHDGWPAHYATHQTRKVKAMVDEIVTHNPQLDRTAAMDLAYKAILRYGAKESGWYVVDAQTREDLSGPYPNLDAADAAAAKESRQTYVLNERGETGQQWLHGGS